MCSTGMGDLIEVKVLAVNLEARKIDLGIVGMEKRTTSNRKISASKKAAMTPAEEKASMRKKGARKAGVEQTAPGNAGKKASR